MLRPCYFRGWALRDDGAAFIASTGADVDNPVTASGNLHIVFDHADGIACIDKPV